MVAEVNEAFCRLTGFSRDEIVGKHFTKLGTARMRDLPKFIKMFKSILKGNAPNQPYFGINGKMGPSAGEKRMRPY